MNKKRAPKERPQRHNPRTRMLISATIMALATSATAQYAQPASYGSSTITYDMVQLQTRPQTIDVYQNIMTPIFFEDTIVEILSGNPDMFSVEVNGTRTGLYLRAKQPVGITDMYVQTANGIVMMFVVNAKPTGLNPKRIEVKMPRDAYGNLRTGTNSYVPGASGYAAPYMPYGISGTFQANPINPYMGPSYLPGGGGTLPGTPYNQNYPNQDTSYTHNMGLPTPVGQAGASAVAGATYQNPNLYTNTGSPAADPSSTSPSPAGSTPGYGTQSASSSSVGAQQSTLTTRATINAQGGLEIGYTLRAGMAPINFDPRSMRVTSGGKAIRYRLIRPGGLEARGIGTGTEEQGTLIVDGARTMSSVEIRWTINTGGQDQSFSRTFEPGKLTY